MRLIHVKLEKIRNSLFVKIPDLISEALHLKEGEEIEISIHSEPSFAQGELWGDELEKAEDINEIYLSISEDLHTLNMYNRIYIPEKYRFFFPPADTDFYLITNIGQIKTHITTSGYFTKGVRSWVEINGPLEPTDKIHVTIIDDNRNVYEMNVDSGNKISNN
jgi:antitoxin component of MazEF toxin-antitoxin module